MSEYVRSPIVGMNRANTIDGPAEMLRDALSPASASETADTVQEPCPPPTCVVCLGLGSVSDSTKAQDQYVMLKELLSELQEEVRVDLRSRSACEG